MEWWSYGVILPPLVVLADPVGASYQKRGGQLAVRPPPPRPPLRAIAVEEEATVDIWKRWRPPLRATAGRRTGDLLARSSSAASSLGVGGCRPATSHP